MTLQYIKTSVYTKNGDSHQNVKKNLQFLFSSLSYIFQQHVIFFIVRNNKVISILGEKKRNLFFLDIVPAAPSHRNSFNFSEPSGIPLISLLLTCSCATKMAPTEKQNYFHGFSRNKHLLSRVVLKIY